MNQQMRRTVDFSALAVDKPLALRSANGPQSTTVAGGGRCAYLTLIEASTNLVDWERIGVAEPLADGAFEFGDPQAAKYPSRFYRVGVSTP
jgi:hypothetical protein